MDKNIFLELKDWFAFFSSGDIYKYDKLFQLYNDTNPEYENIILELQSKYKNITYTWKNGFSFKIIAWQISGFLCAKFNLDRKLGDLENHAFYIMTNLYSAPYKGCDDTEIKNRMNLLIENYSKSFHRF